MSGRQNVQEIYSFIIDIRLCEFHKEQGLVLFAIVVMCACECDAFNYYMQHWMNFIHGMGICRTESKEPNYFVEVKWDVRSTHQQSQLYT